MMGIASFTPKIESLMESTPYSFGGTELVLLFGRGDCVSTEATLVLAIRKRERESLRYGGSEASYEFWSSGDAIYRHKFMEFFFLIYFSLLKIKP